MREARKKFLQKMSHEEALKRAHRLALILTKKPSYTKNRTLWEFVSDWDDLHEESEICLYEIDMDHEGNATGCMTGVMIDDDPYIVEEWLEEANLRREKA